MKHVSSEQGTGLPYAPLAMPRQVLERESWFVGGLRHFLFAWHRR